MAEFQPAIHRYTTPRNLPVSVFLVETEHGVVLIDSATAVSTSHEIRALIDEQIKKPLLALLLTHGHPDHYVGAGEIVRGLDVPIVATEGVAKFAHSQDEHKFDSLIIPNYGTDAPAQRMFPNRLVKGGDVLTFDGVDFALRDYGPCESDDDCTWTVTSGGVQHVFVGDLIYSHAHGYFRDGHAPKWIAALRSLQKEYDYTAVFHPAHGDDCGIEMTCWQIGYIEAFLITLHSLLCAGGTVRDALDDAGKQILIARMQSYLPSEKLITLTKYELDQTIRELKDSLGV